jgi:hypothetical protein
MLRTTPDKWPVQYRVKRYRSSNGEPLFQPQWRKEDGWFWRTFRDDGYADSFPVYCRTMEEAEAVIDEDKAKRYERRRLWAETNINIFHKGSAA